MGLDPILFVEQMGNCLSTCTKRSDGQTDEKNFLTEAPDSAKVKEAVINSQPIPNRTVESVSIATQTDRILLAKAFEEFSPLQNVLDHKYNDMDMDLYRSCRKLSILLEEEDDETLKRIPSIKNAVNSKSFSVKLPHSYKTHSADDITNFEKRINKNSPSEKLISSCTNIIFSTRENKLEKLSPQNELRQDSMHPGKIASNEFPMVCDSKLSDVKSYRAEQISISNSKKLEATTFLDPLEPLRQPHSFDSYLDPQQVSSPALPRQISDPTQSSICDPPLTRRGSYLRRPRSTCRPLRLPCESETKCDERVSKVRFDLSNNVNSKLNDNTNASKGPMPIPNLKNHRKIERISRFTVELVDEDEFRKSINESDKTANRKRPPLIHSVVYKKSVLYDMTSYNPKVSFGSENGAAARVCETESPDSPAYETANENSPVDSFEMTNYESNYLIADIYPCKRRKQSDSSSYSLESQDSIDDNDIIVKSIRLHTNSEYITMKELDRESSASSHLSVDLDIPYIDAEELPVIKPSPEIIKTNISEANSENSNQNKEFAASEVDSNDALKSLRAESIGIRSDSSETFVTACNDFTPTTEIPEAVLQMPKPLGLSKSPTVLKNLANFELYNTVSESIAVINQKRGNSFVRNNIVEEDEEEISDFNEESECCSRMEDDHDEEGSNIFKLTPSDVSEISDTVTYVTVKSDPSNLLFSSDYDSDTYVTIQSDKSTLERKFSDISENSSSPYNTPPDTSSASFCTLPETYSPILHAKQFTVIYKEEDSSRCHTRSSSPYKNLEQNDGSSFNTLLSFDTPPNLSPFNSPSCSSRFNKCNFSLFNRDSYSENESVTIYNIDDSNFPSERDNSHQRTESIIFDSPKLEFYETNDSIENLEAFLNTEEGLQELVRTPTVRDESWKSSTLEDLQEEPVTFEGSEHRYSEMGEEAQREGLSMSSSLESPSSTGDSKFFEKRNKRHPPLSRQNSTEDYNFLDPHDSCLNLSEEISSPSTTPDTSNKTVIFKNKPLTLSNTIDLEDDDFPISESEIQINVNGSETEIVEIAERENGAAHGKKNDIYSCRSEPCIPSISSSADMPTAPRLAKLSSSMTESSPSKAKSTKSDESVPKQPTPPEIIVSNLSSESENDSDNPAGNLIDFPSNVSDRSEINFSDLNSLSGQSDKAFSSPDPSENLISDRSPELETFEPDESLSMSTEINDSSSSSSFVPPALHSQTQTPDLSPHTINTDSSSHTEDTQQFYVDIPEQLTESNVGNLRVVDLSDDMTDSYAKDDFKLEHQTIHGNTEENIETKDSSLNLASGGQENSAAVQTFQKMKANNLDFLNVDIYNIDIGIDINGKSSLSDEELEKKFQELNLAFRTDPMMLQERLTIRKRLRDQAELNIENEIKLMKTKLNNFTCLCNDWESLQQMTDVSKQLDVILSSANNLSRAAEAYGFVQNEKKMSGAVSVIIKQLEFIERIQSEISKSNDIQKFDGKRLQTFSAMDEDEQEKKILRRRSVTSVVLNTSTKRRASLAITPRNSAFMDDCNTNLRESPAFACFNTSSRSPKVCEKKTSNMFALDQLHQHEKTYRGRNRKENKIAEFGAKYLQKSENNHLTTDRNDESFISSDEDLTPEEKKKYQMAVLKVPGSFENGIKKNSVAYENLNGIGYLRKVMKWNIYLVRNSRFQFPESIHQYVPFLLTWYVIAVMVTVFTSGFFIGFNRCSSSQLLYFYSDAYGSVISGMIFIYLMMKFKTLRLAVKIILGLYLWNFFCILNEEGLEAALNRSGIQIVKYYPRSSPPV